MYHKRNCLIMFSTSVVMVGRYIIYCVHAGQAVRELLDGNDLLGCRPCGRRLRSSRVLLAEPIIIIRIVNGATPSTTRTHTVRRLKYNIVIYTTFFVRCIYYILRVLSVCVYTQGVSTWRRGGD